MAPTVSLGLWGVHPGPRRSLGKNRMILFLQMETSAWDLHVIFDFLRGKKGGTVDERKEIFFARAREIRKSRRDPCPDSLKKERESKHFSSALCNFRQRFGA